MKWKQVKVRSRGPDPGPFKATMAYCPSCHCEEWLLFQMDGQSHAHAQCVKCGEVYCPQGAECDDPTWTPAHAEE